MAEAGERALDRRVGDEIGVRAIPVPVPFGPTATDASPPSLTLFE